mgnify:FL=1
MNDNFCKTCVFSLLSAGKQSARLPEKPVNLKSVIFKNIAKNISLLDTDEEKLYCTNENNASKDFVTGENTPVLCDSLNHYGECLFHKTQQELDKEQEDKTTNKEQTETTGSEPEVNPEETTEKGTELSDTGTEQR